MNVTKRNGTLEPLNLEKYHDMVAWTVKGLPGCEISEIELATSPQFFDGIKTSDLHKATTKATADLISLKKPNYQYAAARSLLMEIRKEVFGQWEPLHISNTIKRNIELGFYENVYDYYTEEEVDYFNSKIKHEKDLNFTYSGLATAIDKFIVKHKNTNTILETPQEMNMLIAMMVFKCEPPEKRKHLVVDYYNALSDFEISLPSPIMSGIRTVKKGFASCCLIDSGDSRNSLTAANGAASIMTTHSAGIGLFNGSIRGIGANVHNGMISHGGITPILKWHESAVKWASQGNRGGSATSYHAFWDWEIEKVLTLKSNKSTVENSVKKLDYGIGFNKLFFDRVKENKDITLFSAEETRDLYDKLYDYELWEESYLRYEQMPGIRKKKVSARELLKKFAIERFETGRYYPLFLDNANRGPLKSVIKMSNLCAEILLPVSPMNDLKDDSAEVALCILSNVNAGKIKSLDRLPKLAELLVRSLDNVIDIQEYPLPAAKNSTVNARYLGIGVSDWAHYLAKKKVKYDTQEALDLAEEFMEHWQYHLLRASNNLARERGEANWFRERSKYADGWLPNDGKWRFIPKEDWESLREDIIKYGLRNLTLSAIPPAGTSSDYSNSVSGIDMPRDLIVTKKSSVGNGKQIVPDFAKKGSYYTLATEVDNEKYLKMLSKFQLYVDQSISSNVYWTEKDYELNKATGKMEFPIRKMIRTITLAHELGLKTTYYSTFISQTQESDAGESAGCDSGACSV